MSSDGRASLFRRMSPGTKAIRYNTLVYLVANSMRLLGHLIEMSIGHGMRCRKQVSLPVGRHRMITV